MISKVCSITRFFSFSIYGWKFLKHQISTSAWIAIDLFVVEPAERGARVGTALLEVFLELFPGHEIMLNSEIEVQKFYERFNFVVYKKTMKRTEQERTMNPSPSTKLMIRTKTSKKPITLPKTRDHLNPMRQFLDENDEIPEIYPDYDESGYRLYYSV